MWEVWQEKPCLELRWGREEAWQGTVPIPPWGAAEKGSVDGGAS